MKHKADGADDLGYFAEALSASSEVSGVASNGLALHGDGNIVNQATINDISFAGTGLATETIDFLDFRGFVAQMGWGIPVVNPVC